ncbi:hypothetical protein [Streptosporangium sp. NPDC002607]
MSAVKLCRECPSVSEMTFMSTPAARPNVAVPQIMETDWRQPGSPDEDLESL